MRAIIWLLLAAGAAFGQCGSGGQLVKNPLTGQWDCTASGAAAVYAYTVGVCTAGVAGWPGNLPSSNAPTATGCANNKPVLQFTSGQNAEYWWREYPVPTGVTNAVYEFTAHFRSADTSTSLAIAYSWECLAPGSSYDNPAFNDGSGTWTVGTLASTSTQSTVTVTTTCDAGQSAAIKFLPNLTSFTQAVDWLDLYTPISGVASATVAAGSSGQVQYNSNNALAASSGLAYNDTTKALGVVGSVTVGQTGTATGSLLFNGLTSGTVTVKPADVAGTWTLTLPANDGDANQVLQTNGSGVTSWVANGGHTQNTDTGTTQDCFQLQSGGSGPKLCEDGSNGFQVKTSADAVMATLTTAGVLTLGDGTAPWNLTGLTDDVAPGAPGSANQFTAYVDRTTGLLQYHLNGQVNPYTPALGKWATFTGPTQARTYTLPDAASTLVSLDSSSTLTNKTIDVEGTGNSITTVERIWIPAAGCQNTTAIMLWDTPTSNPAVAACVTGTNTQKGVADFADGANALSMQQTYALPSDWAGAIDLKFKWFTTATSGSVVWQAATICVADAETDDPSFNTASTVTDAAKGTTNQLNDASIIGVTATGCAAGELMHLKVLRDPAHASDDLAATARLIGVEMTIRRAQ